MLKIAHVINLFKPEEGSDLAVAQPLTIATMQEARDFAAGTVEVELFSAHYPEDEAVVPPDFYRTASLERSVLDIQTFELPRKLPLLADILDRLYEATDADYLVYTNVDIALQPYFYTAVARLIEHGYDAFTITRRVIPEQYTELADIVLMQATVGKEHYGHDCFIFRRDAYPDYQLADMIIGAPGVGQTLLWNLVHAATKFGEFRDYHLTFHWGEEHGWKNNELSDYGEYNYQQMRLIFEQLKQQSGPIVAGHPLYPYMLRTKRILGDRIQSKRDWRFTFKVYSIRLLNKLLKRAKEL